MKGAREKLQWVSRRVTTLQEEDIVPSQYGVFSVDLPVMYGERKQNALGQLMMLLFSTGLEIHPSLIIASQLTSLRKELCHARYSVSVG